jgi:hypothetical protein
MDDSRLCAAVDPRRCLQSDEGPAVKLKIEKGSANSWMQVSRFGPLVGLVGRRGGRVIIDNYNRLSLCGYRYPGEQLGYVEGYGLLQNPKGTRGQSTNLDKLPGGENSRNLGNHEWSIPERFTMSWREGIDGNRLCTMSVIGTACPDCGRSVRQDRVVGARVGIDGQSLSCGD